MILFNNITNFQIVEYGGFWRCKFLLCCSFSGKIQFSLITVCLHSSCIHAVYKKNMWLVSIQKYWQSRVIFHKRLLALPILCKKKIFDLPIYAVLLTVQKNFKNKEMFSNFDLCKNIVVSETIKKNSNLYISFRNRYLLQQY